MCRHLWRPLTSVAVEGHTGQPAEFAVSFLKGILPKLNENIHTYYDSLKKRIQCGVDLLMLSGISVH